MLGARLVMQNNGLGEYEACAAPTASTVKSSQYCYLAAAAAARCHSVGFQTETMLRLRQDGSGAIVRSEHDGVRLALEGAAAMHAGSVELPSGFEK